MRPARKWAREGLRKAATVLTAVLLIWGCSSDPVNPGGGPGDPPANQAPTASAGPDLSVSVGLGVTVDGSASADADGDPITYAWTLTPPSGSTAALDDATSESPSFVPDVEGAYALSLKVNDGEAESAADGATVTAVDNTSVEAVAAATGGTLASTDGAMTLTVPAGALAADTEISATLVSAAQMPAVIAGLPGELSVYDLGPDGTTFSTPAEVGFEVQNAVTSSSGSTSMSGALLLSESDGTVEGMSDVVLAQDDADPSKATITGGLAHFSHAVFTAMDFEFRIEAPAEVNVNEPFDVTFEVDVTGAGLGDVVFATVEDESIAPVVPAEGFDPDLQGSPSVVSVTNTYVCDAVGEARIRGRMRFETDDDFGSVVTIQLGKAVSCVEPPLPLELAFVGGMPRARRLLPVAGSDTEITTGGAVRRMNLQTGAVSVSEGDDGSDKPEWVTALADGSYLVHSTLGSVLRYVPGAENPIDTTLTIFDQARQVSVVSEGRVVIASAFGDLGLIQHGGGRSFSDAYRDLSVYGGPQQPDTHLQAIWASPDAQTFIGAYTEGDGDSAFNDTRAAVVIPDPVGTQHEMVPLLDVIDFVVDNDLRHQMKIECRPLGGTEFLCVFTSGFESPGSMSAVDKEDGYVVIFHVDTSLATGTGTELAATVIYKWTGEAIVGGAIYPVDESTMGVAVANQYLGAIEVWHVQGTEVSGYSTVDIESQCPAPVDLITIAGGSLGALACQGTGGPNDGVLVVRNLNAVRPSS